MLRKFLFCLAFVAAAAYGEEPNYWETLSQVENFVNKTYTTRLAKQAANDQLQKIHGNPALSEAEKIREFRKCFSGAFQPEKAENLIHKYPLSWKIHSLALGYDIEESATRTTTVTFSEKFFERHDKAAEESGAHTVKSLHNADFSAGGKIENRGDVKLDLQWNPFKLLEINSQTNYEIKVSGGYKYNRDSSRLSTSLWSQKQQELFQRERNAIDEIIAKTGIKKLHLTFTVTLTNDSDEIMVCDLANAQIPVYMGSRSCNKFAVPCFNVPLKQLEINPGRQADVPFRMELDTTTARELISWMTHHAPSIELTKGNWDIHTASVKDAIAEAGKTTVCTTVTLVTSDFQIQWHVKLYHDNHSRCTLREALNAIQAGFIDIYGARGIFDFDEKGNLRKVSGVPFYHGFAPEDTARRLMAFIKADGKFLPAENAAGLNRYLNAGEYIIYVADSRKIGSLYFALQEQIFQRSLALAETKDAFFQNFIGECYANGWGIDRNAEKAVKYYKLAAEQGYADAQTALGQFYFRGIGVNKDEKKAVKYFRLAADQGYAAAQYLLGWCYFNGRGVNMDEKEAVKYFRLAANQGDWYAQYLLGQSYLLGIGVNKDEKEAVKYYKLAADQGYADAQTALGQFYFGGIGVNKDEKEAVKYYKLAADQGNADAQTMLGQCYWSGTGVNMDEKEGVKYFRFAANQKNLLGQRYLGICYFYGIGINKDKKEAEKYFRLAADQGDRYAQAMLGEYEKAKEDN